MFVYAWKSCNTLGQVKRTPGPVNELIWTEPEAGSAGSWWSLAAACLRLKDPEHWVTREQRRLGQSPPHVPVTVCSHRPSGSLPNCVAG